MDRPLADLERWLQDAIVRPHERRPKSPAATKRVEAASAILPSRHLKPRERVALYSDMYLARMQECLASDYPALVHLVGPRRFGELTRAYLRHYPSRHYSLNMLGQHMPEFLAGPARLPRRALLADVARLELAMTQVFDRAESTRLTPADLSRIDPQAWANLPLRLVDAFEIHALTHRSNAIVTAARKEQTLPDLQPAPTWVAVYRKDWIVWRMDLSQPMFETLSALKSGMPLGAALAAGAASFDGSVEELQAAVSRWFAEWTAEGFFAAIDPTA